MPEQHFARTVYFLEFGTEIWHDAQCTNYGSSITGFVSCPIPSISIVTESPSFR